MGFLELARERYSERCYDSREIEQEKLDMILEAGRLAPTACNCQPERFYVLRSAEAMAKARELTRSHYNAPLMILVCYDSETVWRNPVDRAYDNYSSGEQDASIAAANMMYEAWELGIHSVWVRGFDSAAVSEAFGLPKNIIPVMMLTLGYPGKDAKPHQWHGKRKAIEELACEL